MRAEAAAAPHRARSEAERRALLASQERRFLPSQQFAHLFAGERIAPAREAEARSLWQSLRHSLSGSNGASAARDFFLLSIGLAELSFDRGDLLSQRALIDSALQVIDSPHHAQVLRAQLARSALRAGDGAAAEAWLALCDARSEDLLADTAYRFARAYLDTVRRSYGAVILNLGSGSEVPLSDAFAPECAVLCANAWERSEQYATAVDALVSAKRDLGPIARRRITRFIGAHRSLHLCPASEPEAERRAAAADPTPIEGNIVAGLLLTVMGAYSTLWVGSAIAAPAIFAAFGSDASVGDMSLSLIGGGFLAILLPLGVLFLIGGYITRKQRRHGIPCAAHVLERQKLASDGSEGVIIKLSLLMVPDDAPAYHSSVETRVIDVMVDNFAPGKILIARMHPRDPHDYALEVIA